MRRRDITIYIEEDHLFLNRKWTNSEAYYFIGNNLSIYEDTILFREVFSSL